MRPIAIPRPANACWRAIFRERGFHRVIMAAEFFYHWPRADALYEVTPLPPRFNDVAKGKVRTFGAALLRARELALASVG